MPREEKRDTTYYYANLKYFHFKKWCDVKKSKSEELGKDRYFLTELVPFRTLHSQKAYG